MNTYYTRKRFALAALAVGCTVSGSWAVTTAELQALIDERKPVTVIDIRTESLYAAGHIPNAINVPQRVLQYKKLPPLGRVVIYDRGLGIGDVHRAVQLLNEKRGIEAEALEGGYAAWEMDRGATTQPIGFQTEQLDYITYQDLIRAEDVVLVDLRNPPASKSGGLTRQGTVADAVPVTPLAEKFPRHTVVQSPFEISAVAGRTGGSGKLRRMSSEPEQVPVMVLIDSGDGEAEKTVRMLRANGIRRVVILAGGERIIERDGASGLQRMGMGSQTVEGDDE